MVAGNVSVNIDKSYAFRCVKFNGTDGYIQIPDMNIPGSFSFAVRVCDQNIMSNFEGTILRVNWANIGGILLCHNGANGYYVIFVVDAAAAQRYAQEPTLQHNNRWYHLCVVFDNSAGTLKLYVDGVLGSESSSHADLISLNPSNPTNLFADDGGGTTNFKGFAADARLFSRALSASEVLSVYNNLDISAGLMAHWKLATDANDSSGNGNHGTVINGTFGIFDGSISETVKDSRVTANDKYGFVPLCNGREIMTVHIEEA